VLGLVCYMRTSRLQGDLNFAFDQLESEVNLHKATSSSESPSNVSPDHELLASVELSHITD
jgi:hypothetical protein